MSWYTPPDYSATRRALCATAWDDKIPYIEDLPLPPPPFPLFRLPPLPTPPAKPSSCPIVWAERDFNVISSCRSSGMGFPEIQEKYYPKHTYHAVYAAFKRMKERLQKRGTVAF